MKKISILSLHLGYGGIEKSVVALANLLCEKYEVEIACTYKLYDEPCFTVDSRVKIKYLTSDLRPNKEQLKKSWHDKKIITSIKEAFKAIKCLRLRKKTMVYYIKNCSSDIIIATRDIFDEWLGEYGRDDVIKIGWEHNHYHNDLKYAGNITKSAWNLDYLILVSNSLKKFYSKEMARSNCKCIFIPNIIEKMPKRVSCLENKKLISVGRLSPEKGYLDLLKIYTVLQKKYPDWTLDIIGDGTERNCLETYIEEHDITDKVKLHGFQNKDYIDKMLHDASIYLMSSYTESFGIVLIEAMSHGLPCIAFSSAEGARELIWSGKNGYLIKNRNYSAMIKKISDLIENKEERQRIGKASRIDAKKYTGDIVKEKWFELIESK